MGDGRHAAEAVTAVSTRWVANCSGADAPEGSSVTRSEHLQEQ